MSLSAHRWEMLAGSLIGEAYDLAAKLKAEGREIFDLTSGEPDFETPENVSAVGREAIDTGVTKYTSVDGTRELKQAIQAKYRRENNLEYGLDEICVGAGAKPVVYFLLLAVLDPGDEVIVPVPAWASFPGMVQLCGAKPVLPVCDVQSGYKLTPCALKSALSGKTKVLIVNSPSNPTGAVYTGEELRALGEVLDEHPNVVIIADEIYEHLVYDIAFTSFASANPQLKARTVSVNGVSKAYAMTGWRIGYAAGPLEIMNTVRKLLSHSSGNPTSISQKAAIEALTGPQQLVAERAQIYRARRDRAISVLNQAPGLSTRRPDGAFYLYVDCSATFGQRTPRGEIVRNSVDFCRLLLEEEGVASVPSNGFYAEGALRITYACSDATLDESVRRIVSFCNSLS